MSYISSSLYYFVNSIHLPFILLASADNSFLLLFIYHSDGWKLEAITIFLNKNGILPPLMSTYWGYLSSHYNNIYNGIYPLNSSIKSVSF